MRKTLNGTAVGKRVKALRAERKLSLSEVAERSGLERSHISKIERGQFKTLHRQTVAQLAVGLRCRPEDLAGRQWRTALDRNARHRRLLSALDQLEDDDRDRWERLLRLYEYFLEITGGSIDPYFDVIDLHWTAESHDRAQWQSDLRAGRLTGGDAILKKLRDLEDDDFEPRRGVLQRSFAKWKKSQPRRAPEREEAYDVFIARGGDYGDRVTRASRYAVTDVGRQLKSIPLDGAFKADARIDYEVTGEVDVPVLFAPGRNEFALRCDTHDFGGLGIRNADIVICERRDTGYFDRQDLLFLWSEPSGFVLARVRRPRSGGSVLTDAEGEQTTLHHAVQLRVAAAVVRMIRRRKASRYDAGEGIHSHPLTPVPAGETFVFAP